MADTDAEREPAEAAARVRARRFGWVWLVPIGAGLIVLWLAWGALADRGPAITISFKSVDGLQAGQSRIQYRNVDVGTVQSIELTPDMSHAVVHARMSRAAGSHLTENTRFAIIAPRLGVSGISGLSTIVSGSYIAMYPGRPGPARTEFVGLDEPPVLPPDTPGRAFILRATDLGSLTRGSPISYRGVNVGEVEDYRLEKSGAGVVVTAFIRAPHDGLVHAETRFWNAGGVDLTIGSQGIRFRANSWEQLLSGGIAFDTPAQVLANPPSPNAAAFNLYDNRRAAQRAQSGPTLQYVADFTGDQRGLSPGTGVELQGFEVGEVKEVHLRYDERAHTLVTRATFFIDPQRVQIESMPGLAAGEPLQAVRSWIQRLVGDGLRAQVSSVSFLTGLKVVQLEMVSAAPRQQLEPLQENLQKMPSSASGDLAAILRDVQGVVKNLDRATSGPQLGHALQSLDQTLTRLDQLSREVEPDIKSLIKGLRETADSAQNTLNTVQALMNNTSTSGSDLPRLMRELSDAARSVRGLADYLDRHPEALLRGRRAEQP